MPVDLRAHLARLERSVDALYDTELPEDLDAEILAVAAASPLQRVRVVATRTGVDVQAERLDEGTRPRPGGPRSRRCSPAARRAQVARPAAPRRARRARRRGAADRRPRRRRARGRLRQRVHRRGHPPGDTAARRPSAARHGPRAGARTASRAASSASLSTASPRRTSCCSPPRSAASIPLGWWTARSRASSSGPASARRCARTASGRWRGEQRRQRQRRPPPSTAPGGYFGQALVVDVGTRRCRAARAARARSSARPSAAPGSAPGSCTGSRLRASSRSRPRRRWRSCSRRSSARRSPPAPSSPSWRSRRSPACSTTRSPRATSPSPGSSPATTPSSSAAPAERPSVLLVDGDGAAHRAARTTSGASPPPRPRAACATAWARRGASPPSARPASGSSGTPPCRTTAATRAAAGSAPCWAPRTSRPWRSGAPASKPPLADAAAVLAAARDLRGRSFGPATAKYRELGTLANLLSFNAINTLPTRNFSAASFEGAPKLAAEELHELRLVARENCASCTIGCEHIYAAPGGGTTRVEYENVFALGPLCGVSDPDAVLAASRLCDDLGIDTISAGGTLAWAMECAERGLIDAPWLRFGDAEALTRALQEIGTRERPRRPAGRGLPQRSRARRAGVGGLRPAREGPRAPRLRAAHPPRDGARPRRERARRRPQPLRRLRGRPLRRPRPPRRRRRARGRRHRDRGPRRDHGLAHPLQVPARRVRRALGRVGRRCSRRSPAGTSTRTSSAAPRAASSSPSASSTCARAGRGPRTACPSAS